MLNGAPDPAPLSAAGPAPLPVPPLDRRRLYRLPWSRSDNAGAWVEVTDECNLSCPGCYRHRLEGHRPPADVKRDILDCRRLTNCDGMAIAGGEPLLYPHLPEIVAHMASLKIKPTLLTNGERLTPALARELKKAGLAKVHFHVDSAQNRPGWEGRNEAELNDLRGRLADILWNAGRIQCGYHLTVFPSSLPYLPDVVEWCRANILRVQHISLIAFRTLPIGGKFDYYASGRKVDLRALGDAPLPPSAASGTAAPITSADMSAVIRARFPDFEPAFFLNGSGQIETFKYLVAVYAGSPRAIYGTLGPKTIELVQSFHHFFKGRYLSFLRSPSLGRKVFLLAPVDAHLARAARVFVRAALRDPRHLFTRIRSQSIHLHQPNELTQDGRIDLCDGCLNMMVHQGRLIPSCRLDEYRKFGAALTPVRVPDGGPHA